MTRYADFRSYLDALDALGDLKRITRPVSADLEAAAITRLSYERGCAAPLFENVTDVAPGFRLAGAPAGLSSIPGQPFARMALSIGLPARTTARELVDHLARVRTLPPVPPKQVSAAEAPCKQNILLGEDATLDVFPVPKVHMNDGGKYPGTWGVIVAKTPDGRWTNWSIARIMMIDGKRMTGLVLPGQHIGNIWLEWAAIGEPMPYALVQGGDPAVGFVGGIPVPDDVDEAGYIGALYGEPIEVVRCETVDLAVPASAEIVIEGHLSIEREGTEGPFGEFIGYADAGTSQQPVYSVEAITHRDDPIWPIVAEGRPPDEYHTVTGTGIAASLLADLRAAGLPITTVWLPPRAATHWTVITVPQDWRQTLPGIDTFEFVHRINAVLQTSRAGRVTAQFFVLDDDIDPADDDDLLWALASRVHPAYRQEVRLGWIMQMLHCYTEQERRAFYGPVTIHDGLLPAVGEGRTPHVSFAQAYPAEIRERVLAHWDD